MSLSKVGQKLAGLLPERAGSPFVALAVQPDQAEAATELEVPDPQVGDFLDPGAGVVEEQDQGTVA